MDTDTKDCVTEERVIEIATSLLEDYTQVMADAISTAIVANNVKITEQLTELGVLK